MSTELEAMVRVQVLRTELAYVQMLLGDVLRFATLPADLKRQIEEVTVKGKNPIDKLRTALRSEYQKPWVQDPKKFELDGVPVDLAEFYVANDLEPGQVNAIGRLEVGEEVRLGGGAAPLFTLRRVS